MEVEDACEIGGCGGACLMVAVGAESQEEVGEGIGTAVRGAGGVEKAGGVGGRPGVCEQGKGCVGWPGCRLLVEVSDGAD